MPTAKRGRGRDKDAMDVVDEVTAVAVLEPLPPLSSPALSAIPIVPYASIQPAIAPQLACSSPSSSASATSAALLTSSSPSTDVISRPATPMQQLSREEVMRLRTELADIMDAVARYRALCGFQARRIQAALGSGNSAVTAYSVSEYISKDLPLLPPDDAGLLSGSSFAPEWVVEAIRHQRRASIRKPGRRSRFAALDQAGKAAAQEGDTMVLESTPTVETAKEVEAEEAAPPAETVSKGSTDKKRSRSKAKSSGTKKQRKKKSSGKDRTKDKGGDSDEDPPLMVHTNTFWENIEPYLASITEDHLQWLLPQETKDDEAFKIPKLGKHYLEEYSTPRRSTKRTARQAPATESTGPGDISRRLMSALVHENMVETDAGDVEFDSSTDIPLDVAVVPPPTCPQYGHLEDRIKMELRSIGILDLDDDIDLAQREDDEICEEIRSLQRQLREQMRINNQRRASLFSRAILKMKDQSRQRTARATQGALEEIYLMKVSKRRRRHRRLRKQQKG